MTHLGRVDLNLLMPLAALLQERHVSRAAQRVNLSQPAMSRALQRLREAFGDELLVRGPGGYELTPRGERIQRQLATVLPTLDSLFSDADFAPAAAAESFRLVGTDYSARILGPPLFQRLFQQSPRSTVNFQAWHDRVFDDLARGRTDVVFFGATPPPALHSEELFQDHFVCLMSADHPLSARPRLELDDYVRCSHVMVTVAEGDQVAIDRQLQALGTARTVSLTVPYHTAAPFALPGTQLVATLPWRIVARHAEGPALRAVPAPAEIRDMTYSMSWHSRLDDDPAQRWLRETIRSVAATVQTFGEPYSPATGA
ncbi:LysR family transcriptional regulator [Streptomyces sp. NPDC007148]|uniref:LysR family transcriptional regulator n=1 Tax=Streptomyces sp. NPDC007148 TaxID=3364775 RepID=UPI0036AFF166